MSQPIRVAILDDHQGILDGYLYRLQSEPDMQVVATGYTVDELEPMLARSQAHVLILDLQVPTSPDNPTTFPVSYLLPKLLQIYTELNILVISMHNQRAIIQAVLDAGASGYILKEEYLLIQNLAEIVRMIANQGFFVSDHVLQLLNRGRGNDHIPELSARQMEALTMCAAYPDDSTAELAKRMFIEPSSLRNHLSGVYVKLQVHNRSAAIAKARQSGLLAEPTYLDMLRDEKIEPGE